MAERPLKVLIVDDTVVYRKILTDVVEDCAPGTVVTTAPQGRVALSKMQIEPADVVLLDVEMPDMGGIETLEALKARWPGVTVVMISGANAHSKETTVRALEMGALDFIQKPDGDSQDSNRASLATKLRPLFRHLRTQQNLRSGSRTPVAERQAPPVEGSSTPAPTRPADPPRPRPEAPPQRVEMVAIGVSTGGPNALTELIPALPADLGVPIMLVQHMPPGFTASLATHLGQKSRLRVKEGEEGESLQPNTVYIAPGGRHMVLRRFTPPEGGATRLVIGLNDNPPEQSCRPSVDVLFRSIAAQLDGRVLAVIMTGMGADGLEGVRTLKRKGARCLTQSEASCVVYGMPQVVDDAGLSDESVGLPFLARRISELVRSRGH